MMRVIIFLSLVDKFCEYSRIKGTVVIFAVPLFMTIGNFVPLNCNSSAFHYLTFIKPASRCHKEVPIKDW